MQVLIPTLAALLLNAPTSSFAVTPGDTKGECVGWFQDLKNLAKKALRKNTPTNEERPSSLGPESVGAETISPQTGLTTKATRDTEFFDLKTAIKNRKIRQFVFSKLTEARELDRIKEAPGIGYFKAFKARHENRDVFVKVSMLEKGEQRAGFRSIEHLENEVAWSLRLEELGIGPKVHGVSDFNNH